MENDTDLTAQYQEIFQTPHPSVEAIRFWKKTWEGNNFSAEAHNITEAVTLIRALDIPAFLWQFRIVDESKMNIHFFREEELILFRMSK